MLHRISPSPTCPPRTPHPTFPPDHAPYPPGSMPAPHFIARLKQRKLVQWVIGYLVAAWATLEVVNGMTEMWGIPPMVGRLLFVALAVGLGWAIVLAWFHGERGRQRVGTVEVALLVAILALGVAAGARVMRTSAASLGLGGAIPGAAAAGSGDSGGGADERSLVVLPFQDLSPAGGHEYLGDGIAETLITALGRVQELRVVARTSAFQFKGLGLDVREIARRLGVGSVLEGSVTQLGSRVRVRANLVDASTGLGLWSDQFDKEAEAENFFVLQDEVARDILAALEIELSADRVVAQGTRNPHASQAYFLGMHYWNLRTTEDIARATAYFHEAIEADSTYAAAWGGLALAYVLHIPSEYGVPGLTPTEALDRTEWAARRAIELDLTLSSPHSALGWALKSRARPDEAEANFVLAIEKNPNDATAHHWYADVLLERLKLDPALEHIRIAESLDPVSPAILVEHAEVLMAMGRYDEATAQMDHAVELLPDSPLVRMYAALFALRLEQWERTATHLERRLVLGGERPSVAAEFAGRFRDPAERTAVLRDLALGRAPEFTGIQGAESFNSPQQRFFARLTLGETEAALRDLESAISGPERVQIYGPMLPAAMGPEVLAMPEARRLMEVLLMTPEG